MRILDKELENKKINYHKLVSYGFIKQDNKYIFKTKLHDGQFEMIVCFSKKENIAKLIDVINEEEYILVDIPNSTGTFVKEVKVEDENKIKDIIEKCFTLEVFKSKQAKQVIKYIKEKYHGELEFLWKKFPKNAIWRHQENNRWYGILLVVSKTKLGLKEDFEIDILDVKYPTQNIHNLIDNKTIFAGYHMNKDHWITIPLDGSIPIEQIYHYIDISYEMK